MSPHGRSGDVAASSHSQRSAQTAVTAGESRGLAGGAAISLVAQVSTVAATAIASVVIARLLGPSGLGTYVLVMALVWIMGVVAGLGLPAGFTYYVSRGLCSPAKAVRAGVGAGIGLGAAGGVLTLAAVLLLKSNVLEGVTWLMALAAAFVLPVALATRLSLSVSVAQERYKRWGGLQIAQAVLSMMGTILLAIPFGVTGAVVGFAVGQVVSGGVAITFAARDATSAGASETGTLRGVFRFGALTWSADVLQLLNYRLDIFLLSALVGSSAVGVYSVAVGVTALGWIAPQALSSVVFPRTARHSSGPDGKRESTTGDEGIVIALRHATALVPVTAVGLSALAAIAIPLLYGSAFHQSIALALILIPGVLAVGVAKVVSAIVAGRGHPEYSLYNTLVTAPITIGLYVWLIPALGAFGAALASTLSYMLTTAIAFVFLERVAAVRPRDVVGPLSHVVADYRMALATLRADLGSRR